MPDEPTAPTPAGPEEFLPTWDPPAEAPAPAAPPACPLCGAPRAEGQAFCLDCGFVFPDDAPAALPEPPPQRLRERYEVGPLLSERDGIARYRGHDTQTGQPVV